MVRKERIRTFVQEIWGWYARHKRDLPWRDLWDEPEEMRAYKVLLSEVMLQQTQVARVVPAFRRFLEQFPTVERMASASNREVLLAWRGMGYNRRALMLRNCAKKIADHGFPKEVKQLRDLPGIGLYTAAAIRNFAFNIPTPCLDTNIRRVLHRRFIGRGVPDDRLLLKIAAEVLDSAIQYGSTASWHSALMDYGALVEVAERRPRSKKEPGRLVGSVFIPNRIVRGKIIDALRDVPAGLSFSDIGRHIALDWDENVHKEWLRGLLKDLTSDCLVSVRARPDDGKAGQGRIFLLGGGD